MNENLTEKIFKKCPIIFRARYEGITINHMCFGFVCENGWYEIILELSVAIEAIATKMKAEGVNTQDLPCVVKVKEKFGTLQYYLNNNTCEISNLIDIAKEKSAMTCEVCGANGELRTDGYSLTLCDDCNSINKKEWS